MAFFGRQTTSPVLTLSPQPAHQTPFAMGGYAHQHAPPHSFGTMPFQFSPRPPVQRFASSAGRKRSRDEASVNLEPEPAPPGESSEDGWTYGEGMVLIKSGPSYVADASTQSGTWVEERKDVDHEETLRQREAQQLNSRCHKSQRTGHGLDRATSSSSLANKTSPTPPGITNASTDTTQGPVIDDFTLHLGIGWRQISDDEHIQAAARGWARFIENHYPLSNVDVRLESKGLQSYLVEATEGFFLFAESLRQGQLVSSTVDGALRNLQSSPPVFDGIDVLAAAESPRPTLEVASEAESADMDMKMD